jgi:hypothetical protein
MGDLEKKLNIKLYDDIGLILKKRTYKTKLNYCEHWKLQNKCSYCNSENLLDINDVINDTYEYNQIKYLECNEKMFISIGNKKLSNKTKKCISNNNKKEYLEFKKEYLSKIIIKRKNKK